MRLSLPRRVATIDTHIGTSHEAARIAEHEHSSATELSGFAELAEHVLRWPVPPSFRELFEKRCGHGGHDVAGGDGVDSNAELAPF